MRRRHLFGTKCRSGRLEWGSERQDVSEGGIPKPPTGSLSLLHHYYALFVLFAVQGTSIRRRPAGEAQSEYGCS